MKRSIIAFFCICSALCVSGCAAPDPVPDDAAANQTAAAYMQEKYGTDIRILVTETARVGTSRYKRICFSPASGESDRQYYIYTAFDPADSKTPVVACEDYMCSVLEPLLTEWLNAQTGAEVAEAVNCAQIAEIPGGFRGDFPRIGKPEEAEELIRSQRLSFDYMVYSGEDPSGITQQIQDRLPLFSDDTVYFHVLNCDAAAFAELYRQFKTDGSIQPALLHGQYTETTIKSF